MFERDLRTLQHDVETFRGASREEQLALTPLFRANAAALLRAMRLFPGPAGGEKAVAAHERHETLMQEVRRRIDAMNFLAGRLEEFCRRLLASESLTLGSQVPILLSLLSLPPKQLKISSGPLPPYIFLYMPEDVAVRILDEWRRPKTAADSCAHRTPREHGSVRTSSPLDSESDSKLNSESALDLVDRW